jgi:hypothetical protein
VRELNERIRRRDWSPLKSAEKRASCRGERSDRIVIVTECGKNDVQLASNPSREAKPLLRRRPARWVRWIQRGTKGPFDDITD